MWLARCYSRQSDSDCTPGLWALLLPQPPQPVDIGVMKEEERLCAVSVSVESPPERTPTPKRRTIRERARIHIPPAHRLRIPPANSLMDGRVRP
jgi:hypothetical protein